MPRSSKYATEEERLEAVRAQTRERVKRWKLAHPIKWRRIRKRFRARETIVIPLTILAS